MDATLIYLTSLLGLIGLISLLLIGVTRIVQHREKKRQLLKEIEKFRHAVCKYRLSKMLSFIGIHLDDYLTRIPFTAIRQHILTCKACPNLPICDRCLRDGKYVTDMNFCPNYQSLMAYSRIMPSVE